MWELRGNSRALIASYAILVVMVIALIAAIASAIWAQQSEVIELNEDNWHLMLNGEWMIEFWAPKCTASANFATTWNRFARTAKTMNVNVAKIDVTASPSVSERFFVTNLPTIYHVKEGEFREYRCARDGNTLFYFVKERQWQAIEPLSAWKKPDAIHMSVLSYSFRLSRNFNYFNARLQNEYGVPSWASNIFFTLVAILIGVALGLMLVRLVDLVYPPKKLQRQSCFKSQDNLAAKAVEDLATKDGEYEDAEDDGDADDEDEEDNENEVIDLDTDRYAGSETEMLKTLRKQIEDAVGIAADPNWQPGAEQVCKRKAD